MYPLDKEVVAGDNRLIMDVKELAAKLNQAAEDRNERLQKLREAGATVPELMRSFSLSRKRVYEILSRAKKQAGRVQS